MVAVGNHNHFIPKSNEILYNSRRITLEVLHVGTILRLQSMQGRTSGMRSMTQS